VYGANADATVLVGLAWDTCRVARAFRWEEKTGVVNLGSLGGESTRANAISADGQVIVGWEQHETGFRQAAKWVNGAEQLIKGADGRMIGEAHGVNGDGSLILGAVCDPFDTSGTPAGWTWTSVRGVQCLPVERPRWVLPRPYQVVVQKTSDDGRVMGGTYSFGLDAESLIWLDGQVHFLRDYLQDSGVDAFRGWVNTGFVTGITPDGRTIVGYGAGPNTFQGYLVVLPDRGKE
jgi:probable HAF family extracellular repeat protein